MLERLARLVMRRHWLVAGIWVVLTIIGAYSAVQVSDRWLEDFSIPGYSAYEANQRVLQAFGNGEVAPFVAVVSSDSGDVTTDPGVREAAIDAAAAANPGSRLSSYFNTGSDAYVSADRRTTFAEIHPAGEVSFEGQTNIDETRQALADAAPAGVTTHLTGYDGPLRGVERRPGRGPERAGGGAHRRRRRAGHPAVRLRHPAGRADAAGHRGRRDLQHVHARSGALSYVPTSRSSCSSSSR